MLDVQVFNKFLDELHENSNEIQASAIISDDGMMFAPHLPAGVNEEQISAMSAALLSVSERMVMVLDGSETDRVMVQSKEGYVIVTRVAAHLLLTAMARPDAKLGMVFHDIKRTAQKLQTALGEAFAA